MKYVWLFKSESFTSQLYEELLKQNGYICVTIPTLAFEYINKSALNDALHNPDKFGGLIFTSLRAVQSLEAVFNNLPLSLHQGWNGKKVFAIAKSTSKAVKETLNLASVGCEAQNAQQLAPLIINETEPFGKPLLFPCGNLKSDQLPTLLAQNDRDFRAITCYETNQHPQLKPTLSKLALGDRPSAIVFFSPSGVQFVLPLLKERGFNLAGINVVAVGPTTNAALVSADVPVSGICPEPSPEGLIRILTIIAVSRSTSV